MDSNRRLDYGPQSTGRLSVTLRELTSAGLGWAQARDRHWSCPTLHYGEKYPALDLENRRFRGFRGANRCFHMFGERTNQNWR